MKVTLSQQTPLLQRVARVLAGSDSITTVGYWNGRDPGDLVVGYSDDEALRRADCFAVTIDEDLPVPGMAGCNPRGLAKALASVAHGTLEHVAWAKPGSPRGKTIAQFPPPVGPRVGTQVSGQLTLAPPGSRIAAITVDITTSQGPLRYAVVDDAEFMSAVCWAAGVIASITVSETDRVLGPADNAREYVQACQAAGLVIAHPG